MKSKLCRIASLAFLFFLTVGFLTPPKPCRPLINFAAGHFDAGCHHSGGGMEIEYYSEKRLCRFFRPQASLVLPEFKGAFIGAGFGFELYIFPWLVFTPSFEPGYYFQGHSRNLGSPIEFRSCVQLALEKPNGVRLGVQFYHLSNARLGGHNPGMNALMVGLSIPLTR